MRDSYCIPVSWEWLGNFTRQHYTTTPKQTSWCKLSPLPKSHTHTHTHTQEKQQEEEEEARRQEQEAKLFASLGAQGMPTFGVQVVFNCVCLHV